MPTVEVVDTIAGIDPADWDALCANHAFTQHRWLLLAETVLMHHRPRYVLLRDQGQLVAAAAGTVEHRLRSPSLESKLGWLLRRSPFLHIGIPMMATAGLLVLDRADSRANLAALFQALHDLIRRERLLFCLIDHLPAGHPAWAAQRGYQTISWLPEAQLDLTWATHEEYLAGLPRKKRQAIARIQRQAEHEGIVVRPLTPTADNSPRLDSLVDNVLRRHGEEIYRLRPDAFLKAAQLLGDDLTVLATYRDARIVGCCALLRSDHDLIGKWMGRDYERTAGTSAYHALMVGCVRQATALGVRRLHLGAAAYETKKHLGVRLEQRNRLFAARSGAVNWGVGRVRHLLLRQTAE